MSRCEHGQVMSLYCINEACTWRESGGCQNCFKRYHFHPTNVGTITSDQLDELYRKLIIRPDPKPKSRTLQEALYNYFAIMKTKLSNSIDNVSRLLTNSLNFPYLCETGQFQTFNKIKNKQFRKLNKKQLKSFYEFASSASKQELQQKQKQTYAEQIISLKQKIKKINEAFLLYSQAINDIDDSFQIDKIYGDKINQIASSIQTLLKQGKVSTREGSNASSKSRGKRMQEIKVDSKLKNPPLPGSRDRDRKVSLDLTSEVTAFKTGLQNQTIQSQLAQRKRRLLQIDNPPKNYDMDQIKVDLHPHNNQGIQKGKIVDRSAQKHFPRDLSADKGMSVENRGRRLTSKDNQKSQQHSQIVHTTLPRQASKPKLYEHSKNVKEKKFTVSVKLNENQNTQCPSPLLKKKKTMNQSKGLQLFKVQSMSQQEQQGEKQQSKTEVKTLQSVEEESTKETDNRDFLKQKQADSLALLLSSLSVSAEEAIPLLQAALKYANSNLSAAEYLSYLYLQIGKPKQCLSVCNQFLEQIENSQQADELGEHLLNNKAAAYNMLGRYSESINILQKGIQKKEKDIYYKNLGDAYFSLGISEKAVMSYEKAIKLNPEMDQAIFNLAVCYFVQGNFTDAKLNVQKALKINIKNQNYLELSKQINTKLDM